MGSWMTRYVRTVFPAVKYQAELNWSSVIYAKTDKGATIVTLTWGQRGGLISIGMSIGGQKCANLALQFNYAI